MTGNRILSALLIFAIAGISSCNNNRKEELNVGAAASLTEVLTEIEIIYENNNEIDLLLNFASSGTLRKQIEEGAPSDVFISANVKHMDTLEQNNRIDPESRITLLKNGLVLISSKDKADDVEDILGEDISICIGEPESVPAGQYAKEALEYHKLWTGVQDNLIYTKSVKQVFNYIETGEVDFGIVYRSDVVEAGNSIVVQEFDAKSHNEIKYPVAIIEYSRKKAQSQMFIDFLGSDDAERIFNKYGFNLYNL